MSDDSTLLEIGCGDNPFGKLPRLSIGTKIAVDVDAVGLRHLHFRDKSIGTRLLAADAESMPFRTTTIDGIIAIWVLEHLPNPLHFLDEARRVLKPKGFIFLLTPNLANPLCFPLLLLPVPFREMILKRFGGHPDHPYLTFLRANSLNRLTTLARGSEFDLVRVVFLWEEEYLGRLPGGRFLLRTLAKWSRDTPLESFAGRLYALLIAKT